MHAWAGEYANGQGRVLHPGKKVPDRMIGGLVRNRQKSGEQYCPCRPRSGDRQKDTAIICPCIRHRDEIAGDGHCRCRLYYRKDAADLVAGGQE
jgi:ferredoxin-thioredoxin reductase catalytic subunit